MSKLTCKDLLLLLLYVPGHTSNICEPIHGRTRLMKMVFLFEKELYHKFRYDQVIQESDLPDFKPHNFGPFSKEVFDNLEFLINLGFIESSNSNQEAHEDEAQEYYWWKDDAGIFEDLYEDPLFEKYNEESFALSPLGKRFVEENVIKELSENQLNALEMFKSNCTKVELSILLKYVYKKYHEYTSQSRIKQKVLY
ncbi:hypothetical protein HX99_03730 [Peptococcaceae bacterium SCADC1_2_3]|nr:hypothetical protein HX99_03730 [Peptococcaceae bacterium SCADC1_2_3]